MIFLTKFQLKPCEFEKAMWLISQSILPIILFGVKIQYGQGFIVKKEKILQFYQNRINKGIPRLFKPVEKDFRRKRLHYCNFLL